MSKTTDNKVMSTTQWSKIPSVHSGGKPYFYNTITPDYLARRTVVWDICAQAWAVKGPQTLEHQRGKVYATFATAEQGKAFVEQGKANEQVPASLASRLADARAKEIGATNE